MPYIQVVTSKKLQTDQKELIKNELGKAISLIPGKSEEVLMLCFQDGATLYFQGQKKENTAFVEVNLHGSAELKDKKKLVEKISEILKQQMQTEGNNLFISIPEYPNWGFRGQLY